MIWPWSRRRAAPPSRQRPVGPPQDGESGAEFEVTSVIDITSRCPYVLGTVRSGRFRMGTCVKASDGRVLTINGIELADDISRGLSWIGLSFREPVSLAELQLSCPVGSRLVGSAAPDSHET